MRANSKTLRELGLAARDGMNPDISGLTADSREVKPGFLFAGLPGENFHGAEFIKFALRMEAGAILTDPAGVEIASEELAGSDAALVVAEDPREALSFAAALWFGAAPETMVAVTGTNGKTSVASFTRQIWEEMGVVAASVGTTGVEGAYTAPLAHTTPDPITLHRVLADAAISGVTHAAMEASSHGLAQRRLDAVRLKAAGFTNFSQDHLDYHKDFQEYFEAKARLFDHVLSPEGTVVFNCDDARAADVQAIAEGRGLATLSVGTRENADVRIRNQRFDSSGQDILFEFGGQSHRVRLELIGGFQVSNVLVAAGLVIASGAEASEVFETLPMLKTVRGRMELAAQRDSGASVFVDYAHTPDALETALKALRPHTLGRLIVVFGAGGDRDKGKRPLMGAAARTNADVVFVTDDNPRSERPEDIRNDILQAVPNANEVGDRAEAILRAVDQLGPGDTLLIAGKGHETGQTVGDAVLPFDDVEQASVAVAALEGRLA